MEDIIPMDERGVREENITATCSPGPFKDSKRIGGRPKLFSGLSCTKWGSGSESHLVPWKGLE